MVILGATEFYIVGGDIRQMFEEVVNIPIAEVLIKVVRRKVDEFLAS